MKITDVRIKLVGGDSGRSRLRAFCTLIFDNAFVVTDLKILEGDQGYFVAMPSRKITFHCPYCRHKVIVGSNYCSSCGESVSNAEVARMLIKSDHEDFYVEEKRLGKVHFGHIQLTLGPRTGLVLAFDK